VELARYKIRTIVLYSDYGPSRKEQGMRLAKTWSGRRFKRAEDFMERLLEIVEGT